MSRSSRPGLAERVDEVCDEHALQAHRQRLDAGGLPRLDQRVGDVAHGLAAVEARDAGVFVAGGEDALLLEVRLVRFLGDEECGAAPDADGAHRERGGEAAAIGDAAGGDHGLGCDRVDHLRNEREGGDAARMATRFRALRDDDIGAGIGDAFGVLHVADERKHLRPVRVQALDIQGAGLPRPEANTGIFSSITTSIWPSDMPPAGRAGRSPLQSRCGGLALSRRLLPFDAEVLSDLADASPGSLAG